MKWRKGPVRGRTASFSTLQIILRMWWTPTEETTWDWGRLAHCRRSLLILYFRNELKAQFRALYGQSQASLPTYYSSYLPISYHLPAQPGAPAFLEGGQEETLSPPGELQHPQLDSRRRAFSPERLQSGSKYHPYYVVGGQLDRRAQPSNIHQRRMGPDQLQQASLLGSLSEREINVCLLLQTLPLVQSLPVGCSPHYYDNSHLLLPPGTPTPTLIYTNPAQGAWTIPTLTSSRDK